MNLFLLNQTLPLSPWLPGPLSSLAGTTGFLLLHGLFPFLSSVTPLHHSFPHLVGPLWPFMGPSVSTRPLNANVPQISLLLAFYTHVGGDLMSIHVSTLP